MSRLGVVVAKNIRKATRRNRIKRLVRECFRHHYFAAPLDLVVLARKTADTLDNTAVTRDLQALCRALDQKVSAKMKWLRWIDDRVAAEVNHGRPWISAHIESMARPETLIFAKSSPIRD